MITHPDPQTNAIFASLQDQRDQAVVKAANAEAQVSSLTLQLKTCAERAATAEAALEAAKKTG